MSLPCLPSLSRPAVTSQHLGHVGLRWTTPLTRLAGLVVQDPGRLCGKRRRPVFSGTGHPVLAVPWGVRKPETSTWCRVALSTFSEPVPGALPLGPAGHPRLAADSPSQAPRPPAPGTEQGWRSTLDPGLWCLPITGRGLSSLRPFSLDELWTSPPCRTGSPEWSRVSPAPCRALAPW